MKKETVTRREWSVSFIKNERYHDSRYLQIDLSAPSIDTSKHSDKSVHSDRVMPLIDIEKFSQLLHRKTKTFQGIDNSHFWVSGYYGVYFHLRSKKDRMKIKKIVIECVIGSGGFMSWEKWYKEHKKKHMTIIQFNGTGSGIHQTMNTSPIAFL